MTDKYKDLRDALAAGPTPGPWCWNTRNEVGPRIESDDQSDGMMDAVAYIDSRNAEPNREYIAAAHPETIRALLDERDALREALWVATEHNALHFGESNNTVTQGRAALAAQITQPDWHKIADERAAEIVRLDGLLAAQAAEIERLRGLLAGVLVDDLVPLLPDEYIAAVRAALSGEGK